MSVKAENEPKIIVDEMELVFSDQGPVIAEDTGRTLIPLRFVLESTGARVSWNGETKTVKADAADNRNAVELVIGSNEMKIYYFPSVIKVMSDVVTIDQAPIIMNDRTMIPVRAVLEGLGCKVEWNEETRTINITSRNYARYMRNQGVEGYEVVYPLAEGELSFDKLPQLEEGYEYDPKNDLPALSLSATAREVKVGDTFDIYVELNNPEKIGTNPMLTAFILSLVHNADKAELVTYMCIDKDEEYEGIYGEIIDSYMFDSTRLSSIVNLGATERYVEESGKILKLTFKATSEGEMSFALSKRNHAEYGFDAELTFYADEKNIVLTDADEIYIDIEPVVITAK